MSSETTSRTRVTEVDHLIVGAGFGGLCAAIKLDEDGERDFVVIERGDDVGGTWRDNTYPGAACDVPSQLYSYSFAPNTEWSMSYSPQPEIHRYIQQVAKHWGVTDRFEYRTTVTDAAWDADAERWIVTTAGPRGVTTYAAKTFVVGPGPLSEPRLPEIEGLETFGGEIFHSARWRHDLDLTGKRVAVIGTGASAIQLIPEIQPMVAHLDVYQRTAPWVIPRNEHHYTRVEKAAFRHVPGLQKLARAAIYWGREAYVPAFAWSPKIALPAKLTALRNIRRGIADPALRAAVTPDYEIGCKRILISNRYYPALAAPNVDLITDPIQRVTPTGIVTASGEERPIDVLIVATGFETTDIPIAHHVRGVDGELMSDRFARTGAAAYKGSTVPGFPNLFFIIGPNTGLGHSSMVFIIESQVQYLRDAVRTMRHHRFATVEPTEAAFEEWNAMVQRRMAPTVWNTGGCSSWYLDEHGRNTTLWPSFTFLFRHYLHTFDVHQYVVTGAPDPDQELIDA
ncbi:NAD(P)/FAD-dependent oxidoreductase [Nocardioides sp.]|uniref:flavin-containing monooxygenase n=1 Tax=Nocardioides sp. TaxID=35761 RepID=UPI0026096644|nr:NAD(P)/FAD-dependent oxidoreductase [Nocardioides sp.]